MKFGFQIFSAVDRLGSNWRIITVRTCMLLVLEFGYSLKKKDENRGVVSEKENKDMKSWMSSAQLWSTSINFDFSKSQLKLRNEEDDRSVPENPIEVSNKRSRGGAFLPFKGNCAKEDNYKEVSQVPSLTLMTPMMSEVGFSNSTDSKSSSGGGGSGPSFVKLQVEPPQRSLQQCHRKQRRCWSPELHRRFVDALQQLGGSQGDRSGFNNKEICGDRSGFNWKEIKVSID